MNLPIDPTAPANLAGENASGAQPSSSLPTTTPPAAKPAKRKKAPKVAPATPPVNPPITLTPAKSTKVKPQKVKIVKTSSSVTTTETESAPANPAGTPSDKARADAAKAAVAAELARGSGDATKDDDKSAETAKKAGPPSHMNKWAIYWGFLVVALIVFGILYRHRIGNYLSSRFSKNAVVAAAMLPADSGTNKEASATSESTTTSQDKPTNGSVAPTSPPSSSPLPAIVPPVVPTNFLVAPSVPPPQGFGNYNLNSQVGSNQVMVLNSPFAQVNIDRSSVSNFVTQNVTIVTNNGIRVNWPNRFQQPKFVGVPGSLNVPAGATNYTWDEVLHPESATNAVRMIKVVPPPASIGTFKWFDRSTGNSLLVAVETPDGFWDWNTYALAHGGYQEPEVVIALYFGLKPEAVTDVTINCTFIPATKK